MPWRFFSRKTPRLPSQRLWRVLRGEDFWKIKNSANSWIPVFYDFLEKVTGDLTRSTKAKRAIDKLEFKCENGVAYDSAANSFYPLRGVPDSCPENLSFSNVHEHIKVGGKILQVLDIKVWNFAVFSSLQSCQFSLICCDNETEGCPYISTKIGMVSHLDECQLKPINCRWENQR